MCALKCVSNKAKCARRLPSNSIKKQNYSLEELLRARNYHPQWSLDGIVLHTASINRPAIPFNFIEFHAISMDSAAEQLKL